MLQNETAPANRGNSIRFDVCDPVDCPEDIIQDMSPILQKIRNPLNTITLAANLLAASKGQALTGTNLELARMIQSAAVHLRETIDRFVESCQPDDTDQPSDPSKQNGVAPESGDGDKTTAPGSIPPEHQESSTNG